MIDSKLKYLAWVFIALILSTFSAVAQNRKMDQNTAPKNPDRSIINRISGLSTTQQEQISQLENGYYLVLKELSSQMQLSSDMNEKSALRAEMQQMTESHQTNIKRLLTKDQKKEYIKLLAESRPAQTPQGNGKGQGKGAGGMRGGGQGRKY